MIFPFLSCSMRISGLRDPLLGAQLEARLVKAVVQDLEVCAGMDVAHDAMFFYAKVKVFSQPNEAATQSRRLTMTTSAHNYNFLIFKFLYHTGSP